MRLGRNLGECCGGALGRRDRVARVLGVLVLVGEEERTQRLLHVPLDVVGEHAQEDVGAHAILVVVVDRAHLEVDGLEGAKRALDLREQLVVAHRVVRGHAALAARLCARRRCRRARPRSATFSLVDAEVEGAVADVEHEVLGDLVLVDHLADAHADGVRAPSACP